MIKKISSFVLSFLVIFAVCSAAFFSYAATPEVVKLPFPKPSEILSPYDSAVTFTTSNGNSIKYRMIIVKPSPGDVIKYNANSSIGFYVNYTFTSSSVKVSIRADSQTSVGYQILMYQWGLGDSNYYLTKQAESGVANAENVFTYSGATGDSFTAPNFYGYCSFNRSATTVTSTYLYSGDYYEHWDLQSYVALQDLWAEDRQINNKLSDVVSDLNKITLYTKEILNNLKGEDFTEPPEPTKNQTASDYEQAEKVLSDNAFNSLDNFDIGDFNSSAGTLGEGSFGAFQFLSSNMEFFTGNKSGSYNTSSDSTLDNPFRKISTVIMIVLSLGLVSFILNIVSSKGSDD